MTQKPTNASASSKNLTPISQTLNLLPAVQHSLTALQVAQISLHVKRLRC